MIEAGIGLLDRLIQLLSIRDKSRERYFHDFVEPMYQDAESILRDYIALFQELSKRLENGSELKEIISWIEERRLELRPLRLKLRALLEEDKKLAPLVDKQYLEARGDFERAGQVFATGILRLMKGGISVAERGHIPYDYHRLPIHTVLDLTHAWSRDATDDRRSQCIESVRYQLDYIQKAWSDISTGYAAMKRQLLN